jgi:hypothetical protein
MTKAQAELFKRSADNKLVATGEPKDIAKLYLNFDSSRRKDHYIEYQGKTYGKADDVKKLLSV